MDEVQGWGLNDGDRSGTWKAGKHALSTAGSKQAIPVKQGKEEGLHVQRRHAAELSSRMGRLPQWGGSPALKETVLQAGMAPVTNGTK